MPRKALRRKAEKEEMPAELQGLAGTAGEPFAPLAERVRPKNLGEVVGQTKLLGAGKVLDRMVRSGKLHSMVLWGPPGTGKTTIAQLLADAVGAPFIALSAVNSSVRELRESFDRAKAMNASSSARTVLFIDEIHRFSKSQQDALLGAVEHGTVTLIGATTENPSFEVISPLLSRARVLVLEPLTDEDLRELLSRALSTDEELAARAITIANDAERALIALSGGDARKMLNGLELAVQLAQAEPGEGITLTQEVVEQAIGRKASRYDKGGEEHYNVISAFIKSMRGSDPNAAIYWLARMIEAGEDLEFIARRMIIFASEDVGNADPNALLLAVAAWEAGRAVGWPEAQIPFAHVVTYLATTSKSNASYMAIGDAMQDVADNPNVPVPLHLRNAPTKLMKSLGYSQGYKYAHNYRDSFARDINYLPDELTDRVYYKPGGTQRERAILERLQHFWPEKYPKG